MKKLAMASIIAALLSGCVSNPSSITVTNSSVVNPSVIQATRPAVFNEKPIDIPPVCISGPAITVNLDADSSYVVNDPSQSNVDPARKKKSEDKTNQINQFDSTLNAYADRYVKNNDDIIAAQCAITALDSWARGNGFLGEMRGWLGTGMQKWQLAEFASVYFRVRGQATPEQDARIKWWLKELSKPVKKFCDEVVSRDSNNHMAWCGAAIMQVGIITNDKADIEWARKAFNNQMSQVRADGSLPLEIGRRAMALHYHNFAMLPLAYMAELSKVIGEDWWANEKLQRLTAFTINAEVDPSGIEKLAGIKQVHPWGANWGWVALLPNNDARREKLLSPYSKTEGTGLVAYLGGNLIVFRDMIEQKGKELINVQPLSQ